MNKLKSNRNKPNYHWYPRSCFKWLELLFPRPLDYIVPLLYTEWNFLYGIQKKVRIGFCVLVSTDVSRFFISFTKTIYCKSRIKIIVFTNIVFSKFKMTMWRVTWLIYIIILLNILFVQRYYTFILNVINIQTHGKVLYTTNNRFCMNTN